MATTSQRLVEGARHSKEIQAATTPLPAYVTEFQSVFTKEDFNILLEHCKWDPLSPLEQTELNAFLEENLHTGRI